MRRNKINQGSYLNKGKIEYDFDFQKEKLFYSHLCFEKMKKKSCVQYQKNLKELNENKDEKDKYTFETYLDWKRYILKKYNSEEYSKEKLINFSAYLNLGCMSWGVSYEWKNIFFSAGIASIFTILYGISGAKEFGEINKMLATFPMKIYILGLLIEGVIVGAIFFLVTILLIWKMTSHSHHDKLIQNMYLDYKKIIDELIEKKKKRKHRKRK